MYTMSFVHNQKEKEHNDDFRALLPIMDPFCSRELIHKREREEPEEEHTDESIFFLF